MSERIGLGRALWIFGLIQAVGFLGYVAVDRMTAGVPCAAGPGTLVQPFGNRLAMYGAVGVENLCQGMATGAFGVLLLRLTQKQFSATQYALFSSIFALGRTLAGPPAGFLVDAIGWTPFFVVSVFASIPGLVLLQRFVPFRVREPDLEVEEERERRPVTRGQLLLRSSAAGAAGFLGGACTSALLAALKAMRARPGSSLGFFSELARLLSPGTASDWVRLAGPVVLGSVTALAAAALLGARRGIASSSPIARAR
jgi:PAT family beta-lactamase induction signal transducer AmpG